MDIYELRGNEVVKKTTTKIDCGDCVTTKYFDPISGEELRTDVEILVDPVLMQGLIKQP